MSALYVVPNDDTGAWEIHADDSYLCELESKSMAERIVQSVNARDELVKALHNMTCSLRTFRNVPREHQEWVSFDEEALQNAFDLLAKLEGGVE